MVFSWRANSRHVDRTDHKAGGWLNSLRRMSDSLIGLAHSRLEILALELQEEKLRALKVVVWLVIALTFGVAGLLVGLGALAFFLWNIAGYYGVGGLALASLAAGAGILRAIYHGILNGPTPFAATIDEFRKDRECLRSDD